MKQASCHSKYAVPWGYELNKLYIVHVCTLLEILECHLPFYYLQLIQNCSKNPAGKYSNDPKFSDRRLGQTA